MTTIDRDDNFLFCSFETFPDPRRHVPKNIQKTIQLAFQMENSLTKDDGKGICMNQQPAALWTGVGENKNSQKNIANDLADHGYSLESVVGGGKVSTIWFGKFNSRMRKVSEYLSPLRAGFGPLVRIWFVE